MPLEVGEKAPDFTLLDQHGQTIQLSSYAGTKAVLIVFYPFAFSGVCTGELTGFRDRLGDFETDNTTIVAISCDPIYTQRAFADRDGIFFPLLADFWPHGEVTRAYGVFDDESGAPLRSSFVVDRSGLISWAVHNEMGEARDMDTQATQLASAV